MHKPLQSHEEALIGGPGTFDGFRTITDPVCTRIEWLITHKLERVAARPEAFSALYVDPQDNRYWELSYPEHAEHTEGDGPPTLKVLTQEEARASYQL